VTIPSSRNKAGPQVIRSALSGPRWRRKAMRLCSQQIYDSFLFRNEWGKRPIFSRTYENAQFFNKHKSFYMASVAKSSIEIGLLQLSTLFIDGSWRIST
jgi:hypothetical protein